MSFVTPNTLQNLAGQVFVKDVLLKLKALSCFKKSLEELEELLVKEAAAPISSESDTDELPCNISCHLDQIKILTERFLDLEGSFSKWFDLNSDLDYDLIGFCEDIAVKLRNCTKKFHLETFILRYFVEDEISLKSCHLSDTLMITFLSFLKTRSTHFNYALRKVTLGSFCRIDCSNIDNICKSKNNNNLDISGRNFDIPCIDEAGCSGLTCFKNVNGLCGGITTSNFSGIYEAFTEVDDLTVIVDADPAILTSLSDCADLRILTLFTLKGSFSCNELSAFFFCDRDLPYVKECDIKLRDLDVTFPELESLTFGWVKPDQYDFFNMFVNFYGKYCHLTIYLHAETVCNAGLSWFEQVISHNVIIAPSVALTECELVFKDLFLRITPKSFDAWENFTKLTLNLGCDENNTTGYLINVGKKFDKFLKKYCKINKICFRISNQVSEEYVNETVVPALKNCGSRFKSLSIMGSQFFLSHKSISAIVNLCPNLQELKIVGEKIVKYQKDVKIIQLSELKKLFVVWSDVQSENVSISQSISKLSSDLIKSANNLTHLHISANTYLLNVLKKHKFSEDITTLAIDFHLINHELERIYFFEELQKTNEKTKDKSFLKRKLQMEKIQSSDLVRSLFKILKSLPKLTELIIKISADKDVTEKMLDYCALQGLETIPQTLFEAKKKLTVIDDIFFDALKHYLDRTEITVRHFQVNDVLSLI